MSFHVHLLAQCWAASQAACGYSGSRHDAYWRRLFFFPFLLLLLFSSFWPCEGAALQLLQARQASMGRALQSSDISSRLIKLRMSLSIVCVCESVRQKPLTHLLLPPIVELLVALRLLLRPAIQAACQQRVGSDVSCLALSSSRGNAHFEKSISKSEVIKIRCVSHGAQAMMVYT